jgi:putative ABC transport system permease protein
MIPVTYRANFSYLLRHPWQLALAVVGIGIGVAVIVAVDLANTSARKAFELSMDAVSGAATHQIIGGPRGVDESLYVRLRVDHGIRGIAPAVEGSVDIGGRTVRLLGVDLFAERQIRDLTRTPEADTSVPSRKALFVDFLTEPGTVLMSRGTAGLLGIAPGDRFELIAAGGTHRAVLLGTFGDAAQEGLDDLLSWTSRAF